MKLKLYITIFCFSLLNSLAAQPAIRENNSLLNTFKNYITGDFDNENQLIEEIKKGKYIHPLAIHVNRDITKKITNLPKDFKGFFLLEESYYLSENKPLEIKPYLFHFSMGEKNTIKLNVYQFPINLKKENCRNDNDSLRFNFNELKLSPTFKGATYTWNTTLKTFNTNSPNDLPNGMKFTLTETLYKNKLLVMELLEKDGKKLTAYDTPIIYLRKITEK